jgi:hypothetical protein
MRVGTMFWGEIERHEGESLTTKFLLFGPILLPLASFYRYKGKQYDIPLNWRSASVGYAQAYSTAGALLALAAILFSPRLGLTWAAVGAPALVVLGGLAYLSHFRWTRLSAKESARREIMRQVTGLSGLPDRMPQLMAKQVHSGLKRTWGKRWKKWAGQECWKTTLATGTTRDNMGFLAVMATYANALEPSQLHADLEERAWTWLETHVDEEVVTGDVSLAASLAARVKEQAGVEDEALVAKSPHRNAKRATGKRPALRLQCPHCEEETRVPREYAGKRGLCPRCKKAIEVPSRRAA